MAVKAADRSPGQKRESGRAWRGKALSFERSVQAPAKVDPGESPSARSAPGQPQKRLPDNVTCDECSHVLLGDVITFPVTPGGPARTAPGECRCKQQP